VATASPRTAGREDDQRSTSVKVGELNKIPHRPWGEHIANGVKKLYLTQSLWFPFFLAATLEVVVEAPSDCCGPPE
jgi:hypothetical protein